MAKQTKSQVFTKAIIYYDTDENEWKIEEADKDGSRVYSLTQDVLMPWSEEAGLSITIKKEADYAPRGEV